MTIVPVLPFARSVRVPAVLLLFLWFAMQLAYGASSLGLKGANVGGVAWWAHIGGFLAGMVLGAALTTGRRR